MRAHTRKIREVDRLQEIAITESKLSNTPSLRQPGEGVGWNEDAENSRIFAEPLEQLMARCKLGKSDITVAAIDRRVKELINATSIITLYRAVATAAELQEYLGNWGIQLELDDLDAETLESFLLSARAQRRAGNSLVWMSSNLQLGWPVTELEETTRAITTHTCDYICFGRLRPPGHNRKPLLALWHAPPKAFYERRSLVAQPGMFRKMEDAIHNTRVFPNALTFRTVLGIDTSSTAVPAIKVAAINVGLIIAEAVSYSCICDFISVSSFAFAFCAEFSIDTGSTAVPSIKRTMSIVVVILAKTIPNQCWELAVYI